MTRHDRPSSNGTIPPVLDIKDQPDEASCGPTCLEAIYRHHGDDVSLESVITGIQHLPEGGTLAVFLALDALDRGYRATIYTYNLRIFDPSWFTESGKMDLEPKLERQRREAPDAKVRLASAGYLDFLSRGGRVFMEELGHGLLDRYFDRSIPVLAGLSATFLYRSPRERANRYDDVLGEASGHFVVLSGNDAGGGGVRVLDPYRSNPFGRKDYSVSMERLSGAIYLGVLTYDANLLVIEPDTAP